MESEWNPADATRALFELYSADIYKYALHIVGIVPEAEDVVQETFARVLRGWAKFDHRSMAKTWLWTIARNCVNDALRRHRSGMSRFSQSDVQLERIVVEDSGDKLELQDAMEKLRVSYRQAVTLRYIQDMTTEETAQILRWSQGKVRTTLHRALMALQKELSEPVYDIRQRRYET